jgi:hypothetical protein
MNEGFVLIKTFSGSSDHYIYPIVLDSWGIPFYMKDEFSNSTSQFGDAINGVKLLVRNNDLNKTLEALRENNLPIDFDEDEKPSIIERFILEKILANNTESFGFTKTAFRVIIITLTLIIIVLLSALLIKHKGEEVQVQTNHLDLMNKAVLHTRFNS